MFRELLAFIFGYPDHHYFEIDDDKIVHGLKFRSKEKYPWNNKKECSRFYDDLFLQESIENYQKLIHWDTIKSYEMIHIFYSWALIADYGIIVNINHNIQKVNCSRQ